jgi:hypothetical protein
MKKNKTDILLPEYSSILLDTNFFIDLFQSRDSYTSFFDSVRKNNISLVACDLVKCEFIRTKDNEKLIDKSILFSEIVSTLLPMDKQISELIVPTLEQYGSDLKGVSTVDIILCCFIKRYKGLYLLTANHKDFPTKILERSHTFCIEQSKEIKTYALYQYTTKKLEIEAEDIPF